MKLPIRPPGWLYCTAAALVLAACASRDARSPALPTSPSSDLFLVDDLAKLADTALTVLVINPDITTTYQIAGGHRLWVQQGGLCALDAPYGPGVWDDLCALSKVPVVVIAKSWMDAKGHPHVDFSRDLRFAPLGDKRASAELYLKDKSADTTATLSILYCNEKGCIDESRGDSSMVTQRDRQQGYLFRRIKHFSGYQVSTGRDDDPPPDSSVVIP